MPYPNEHACRLLDPKKYKVVGSSKRKSGGKSYRVLFALPRQGKGGSLEQAYRYPKDSWSAVEARKHCQDHRGSFEAATKEGRKMNKTVFQEGKQVYDGEGIFKEAKLERDENDRLFVRNMSLCGPFSKNKVRYVDALRTAVAEGKYEGVKMYYNHDAPGETRDVRLLWGRTVNSRFDEKAKRVHADAKVRNKTDIVEDIQSLVEDFSDVVGNSHVADCRWKLDKEDWKDVKYINTVLSVDLVDNTGTTKGMFEQKQDGGKEDEMENVAEFKEKYPDLAATFEAEVRKDIENVDKMDELQKKVEVVEAENKTLKDAIKAREDQDKIRESKDRLDAALKESTLPEELKNRIREKSDGKVLDDETIKNEMAAIEEIGRIYMKGTDTPKVPETKLNEEGAVEETKKRNSLIIGNLLGVPEDKKEEEKKE